MSTFFEQSVAKLSCFVSFSVCVCVCVCVFVLEKS